MRHRIILLCLAAGIVTGCASQQTADVAEEKITPVSIMTVAPSRISSTIVYAGQTSSAESVAVSSKISGKVKEIFFDVGDAVNEGDVLFTLDEIDISNQIRQLEGQLAVAEQGVKTAQNAIATVTGGQYSSQLLQLQTAAENAERQVEAARLALKNSEITVNNAKDSLENITTTYTNTKILYEAGSVSKNDYERAELAYKQAQAGLEQATVANNSARLALEQAELVFAQATESLALAEGDVKNDNLETARLAASQAEASRNAVRIQLEIANDTLADTAVKAPITGVVSARSAKAAEYTSTQLAAFSIVNLTTVTVDVMVSELIINHIQPGQEVDVYINTVSSEPLKGRLKTISPAANAASMYPVKIELDNPDGLIKPGMFAEAHFVRAHSENAVVLPRNTVFEDQTGRYVYTDGGGFAKKTVVTTGIDNGSEIEVLSGLAVGDSVIVKGQDYVNDGDKISVIE